jgi:CPA2 family monovalent cation:H+ antiporter-2
LKAEGLPVVVIDGDRRRIEDLRARGVPAIYGDASTPGVLEAARIGRARLLMIATPEGYQTRQIIELARQINPKIDTAVRTHSESEVAYLERQGVGVAIMGERELAFGLMEYALRSLGVSQYKTQVIVQNLRTSGEGGAFERHAEVEPRRNAPELRHHRETEESLEG